jgi:hypothetical protein
MDILFLKKRKSLQKLTFKLKYTTESTARNFPITKNNPEKF